MTQSLENFVSTAIQGTQVPMYTKHIVFVFIYLFFVFFVFLYQKQNKKKLKINKQKHVKQNKA